MKPKRNEQFEKFKEAARELETDDREEAFDAMVKKIAKAPPVPNRSGTETNDDGKRR